MIDKRVVMAEASNIYHDYRVQKQAGSLAAAGYSVHVHGFRSVRRAPRDTAFQFRLSTLPIAPRRLRALRNLSMFLYIAIFNLRLIVTRADVYHAHNTMFLLGMYLGARLHRGRFIYDAHEVQWEHGRAFAIMERLFIRRADAVINVSPGRARAMAERYGIHPEHITIISNYPIYDPDLAVAPRSSPSEVLRLVFSGGYELSTNPLDNLLRAMVRVPGIELHLMAFGYRDGETVMRRLVQEHELQSRVHFLPLVKPHEVMTAIRRFDVAVNLLINPHNHCSIRHPSVNKMYEYLAAGLPIFCSDLEGFVEEFVDEGAAVAVDANSVDAIVEGLHRLLDMRDDLPRMRERALSLVHDRYNWRTQEAKLLKLYHSLVAQAPALGRTCPTQGSKRS